MTYLENRPFTAKITWFELFQGFFSKIFYLFFDIGITP